LCAQIYTHLLILVIVFFAALCIQLIYLIIFIAAFGKTKAVTTTGNIPLSVIVCAHDEETNLRELIPALLSQNYSSFEVIIVNDRSNDNTYDFLLEETKRDLRLKMVNVKAVPDHVNNKKYALTLGIRAAANDWIVFTDADCRPVSQNWLSKMSEQASAESKFVLGFSPYMAAPGFLNLFIRFESLMTALQYLSFALLKNPYMGVGRNLAYRKSLFLEKKGFNNYLHIMGGDDDLFVNQHATGKNTKVQIHPESIIYSVPKTTWKSFFHQKVRHLSVGKHYKFGHKLLLALFNLSWIVTWFLGIPLAIFYSYYYVIIAGLVLKLILLVFAVRALVRRTKLSFKYWAIPLLDFLYPFYYISTGLVSLLTKKVRWKS
jgi:glycosyltransferase involved in cell wall biosynthesis